MNMVPEYSLFPNKEEWGTGDEAMDNKLSIALKKVKENLTLLSISEFYLYGLSLKPRTYNPGFHTTIELVTKAFLYCFDSEGFNDQLMQKLKGDYFNRNKVVLNLPESDFILNELKMKKIYRYKSQIDFYLHRQDKDERNPFVRHLLKRAPIELHTKIILKEFKAYLSGEKDSSAYDDLFFHALRTEGQILLIDKLGEFWYHQGQIFSFPTFDI
jgi:hypothetical protein